MAFSSFKSLVEAQVDSGKTHIATFRKAPTQATTRGVWFDISMSPGNPSAQYYAAAPLVATVMAKSTDGGINHGVNVSTSEKHLNRLMVMTTTATALPMRMMLCDYLLYYPFIDESNTDEQLLDNSTALTRYTDGAGVQVMAVSVAARTGGQQFYFTYTNSDGVAGRVSKTVIQNTVSVTGSIVTTAQATELAWGPFIPLQDGDTGVRSIESVTMLGADIGLFSLVLVKPILDTMILGIDAPVEVDCLRSFSKIPVIEDDAYLNFICCPIGSLAATQINGTIETFWS